MAKVTADNLNALHVRAGRALLGMSAREFAECVGYPLTIDKVKAIEAARPSSASVRQVIIEAFEARGVELLNGGKPGARFTGHVGHPSP